MGPALPSVLQLSTDVTTTLWSRLRPRRSALGREGNRRRHRYESGHDVFGYWRRLYGRGRPCREQADSAQRHRSALLRRAGVVAGTLVRPSRAVHREHRHAQHVVRHARRHGAARRSLHSGTPARVVIPHRARRDGARQHEMEGEEPREQGGGGAADQHIHSIACTAEKFKTHRRAMLGRALPPSLRQVR